MELTQEEYQALLHAVILAQGLAAPRWAEWLLGVFGMVFLLAVIIAGFAYLGKYGPVIWAFWTFLGILTSLMMVWMAQLFAKVRALHGIILLCWKLNR